ILPKFSNYGGAKQEKASAVARAAVDQIEIANAQADKMCEDRCSLNGVNIVVICDPLLKSSLEDHLRDLTKHAEQQMSSRGTAPADVITGELGWFDQAYFVERRKTQELLDQCNSKDPINVDCPRKNPFPNG